MELYKTFITNFLYGGIVLGILLTIIDKISASQKTIAFYAFVSGSFFFVNLIQYYYIKSINNDYTRDFLFHSITGGLLWVVFSIILFFLFVNNVNMVYTQLICIIIIIIVTYLYYTLLNNKHFLALGNKKFY